jgi:hypothetical protein
MDNIDNKVSFEERNDGLKSQVDLVKQNKPFMIEMVMKFGIKSEKTAAKVLIAIAIIILLAAVFIFVGGSAEPQQQTFDDLTELEKQSIPFELREYLENNK